MKSVPVPRRVGAIVALAAVAALIVVTVAALLRHDLSNMLLTLSLRSDPGLVYQRATRVFTPDEVAEALASAVGLTIPTELQAKMKADGRPLLQRLRELAPPRERVSIQRWSTQRLLLTAGAALGTLLLVGLFLDSLRAGLT